MRFEGAVLPKFDGPPVGRGREMCGFIVYVRYMEVLWILKGLEVEAEPPGGLVGVGAVAEE